MKQIDLARALGLSLVALWKLKRRGMPTDNLEEAIRWRSIHLVQTRLKGVKRGTEVKVLPAEPAMVNAPASAAALAEPPDPEPESKFANKTLIEAPPSPIVEATPKPARRQPGPPSDGEIMRRMWARGGDPYQRPGGGWWDWRK